MATKGTVSGVIANMVTPVSYTHLTLPTIA
mgnify:CR=1 FL=1